jgi:tol-pal system protein YbgF
MAQVQVVESSPQSTSLTVEAKPAAAVNPQTEMFYQLQALQQEVLELRGLVEVQNYEIKRLKQQRLDDYVDLDRRIVAFSCKETLGSASKPVANATISAPKGEKQNYDQALALLRERNIEGSVKAFNQHLLTYPGGQYSANVHYWLGETYLLQDDLEAARQAFTVLADSYPEHRKAVDARYKLGTVYFQLGDKVKAKTLLDSVASGSSSAAGLARKYLQQHYSQ